MPVENRNTNQMSRYQDVQGLERGLVGGINAVIGDQKRAEEMEQAHLRAHMEDERARAADVITQMNQNVGRCGENYSGGKKEIISIYKKNSANIDALEQSLAKQLQLARSNEDFERIAEMHSLVLGLHAKTSEARFDNFSQAQKVNEEQEDRCWDAVERLQSNYELQSSHYLKQISNIMSEQNKISERQMTFWSQVVDQAIKAKAELDRQAIALREQDEKDRGGEHARDLEIKQQNLTEFLERTKIRIEENREIHENSRKTISLQHDKKMQAAQRADAASLAELEMIAKHKLKGKTKYWHSK